MNKVRAARVVLQLVYPQGSQNTIIQYSMLLTFLFVLACFSLSLVLILRNQGKMQQNKKSFFREVGEQVRLGKHQDAPYMKNLSPLNN